MVEGTGTASLTIVSDGTVCEILVRMSIDGNLLTLRSMDGRSAVAAVQVGEEFHRTLSAVAAGSALRVPLDALHAVHLEP